MLTLDRPDIAHPGFRVVLGYRIEGDPLAVHETVLDLYHRVAWMNRVPERYGEVFIESAQDSDLANVSIEASAPRRPNVRSAGAARLMVEAALDNETRSRPGARITPITRNTEERES